MKRSGKKLTELEKVQILQESYESGCIISELAKQYGISAGIIYRWRRKEKTVSVAARSNNSASEFVELSVQEARKEGANLKRAVLEFNNLSICIDGDIKSSTLVQMLNILEESC